MYHILHHQPFAAESLKATATTGAKFLYPDFFLQFVVVIIFFKYFSFERLSITQLTVEMHENKHFKSNQN